ERRNRDGECCKRAGRDLGELGHDGHPALFCVWGRAPIMTLGRAPARCGSWRAPHRAHTSLGVRWANRHSALSGEREIERPARGGTVRAGRANRGGGGRGADAPIELSSSPRLSRRDQLASDAYWSPPAGIWFTARSKNLLTGISAA